MIIIAIGIGIELDLPGQINGQYQSMSLLTSLLQIIIVHIIIYRLWLRVMYQLYLIQNKMIQIFMAHNFTYMENVENFVFFAAFQEHVASKVIRSIIASQIHLRHPSIMYIAPIKFLGWPCFACHQWELLNRSINYSSHCLHIIFILRQLDMKPMELFI